MVAISYRLNMGRFSGWVCGARRQSPARCAMTWRMMMAENAVANDLESMPVEAVLEKLGVDPGKGLSAAEAQKRLAQYGPNALPEEKTNLFKKIAGHFVGPIAFMIEAAALVSLILGDWGDFFIIFGLLVFNAGLEFYQDSKATSALAALKNSLAPQATALRDGKFAVIDAATLVPGDIIKISCSGEDGEHT